MKHPSQEGFVTDGSQVKRANPYKTGLVFGIIMAAIIGIFTYCLTLIKGEDWTFVLIFAPLTFAIGFGMGLGMASEENSRRTWGVLAEGTFDRVDYISRSHSVPDTVIRFQDGRVVTTSTYHKIIPFQQGAIIRVERNRMGETRLIEVSGPRS